MSQDDISSISAGDQTLSTQMVESPTVAADREPDSGSLDLGLSCLLLIAGLHGIVAEEAQLRHEFGHNPFSA
jgi:ATP-binding cassette, subfamily B, bacterial HlyB/CyaB